MRAILKSKLFAFLGLLFLSWGFSAGWADTVVATITNNTPDPLSLELGDTWEAKTIDPASFQNPGDHINMGAKGSSTATQTLTIEVVQKDPWYYFFTLEQSSTKTPGSALLGIKRGGKNSHPAEVHAFNVQNLVIDSGRSGSWPTYQVYFTINP